MRTRSAMMVAALAAGAVGLTGCPADSCPLEVPQVDAMASCTEVASQPVSYPVRLCPTCNQTGATCVPNLSALTATTCPTNGTCGEIFLDIKVEACRDSTSCGGAGCAPGPTTCAFTAPAAPGTYTVITSDAATGGTKQSQLVVIASGAESCAFPTAGI